MSQPVEQDPARRLGRVLACLIPIGLGHLGANALLTPAWPQTTDLTQATSAPSELESIILVPLVLMFYTSLVFLGIEFSSRAERKLSSYKTGFILNLAGTFMLYGLMSSQVFNDSHLVDIKQVAMVAIAILFLGITNFLAYSLTMRTFGKEHLDQPTLE